MQRGQASTTKIVLDCDDVLLDWIGGFRSWLQHSRGILTSGDPNTWNMDDWLGRPALPLVRLFNSSSSFGLLGPVEGAQEAIAALYAAGHELHVISSCCGGHDLTTLRRSTNLDRIFGDVFTSITCVPLGAPKVEALEEIGSGVWIEDNPGHAIDGCLMGFDTFCLRKPHNVEFQDLDPDGFTWTDDFRPVLDKYASVHA